MATAKKKVEFESTEEIKGNIEGLSLLKAEYLKNEMQPKKLIALKNRLVELYKDKSITESENELLVIILKKERIKSLVSEAHLQILNEIEMKKCTDKCIVKSANAPAVHYLTQYMECDYYRDYDNDRFVVFVERKIPSRWQLTKEILEKEERGHFPPEEAYPKDKILIHRLNLKEKEFNMWFEVEEDLLKPNAKAEETYTF